MCPEAVSDPLNQNLVLLESENAEAIEVFVGGMVLLERELLNDGAVALPISAVHAPCTGPPSS